MSDAAAVSVIIPPTTKQRDFSGDPKIDKEFGVKQFIADIDKNKSLHSWTDEQTAAYALSALKGPAAIFAQRVEMDDAVADILDSWATIAPALEKRFAPAKGYASADVVQDLKMVDTESFRDFLDRCTLALQKMNEDLSVNDRGSNCYKRMFKRELTNMFLNGVNKKTRSFLMTHHKDKSPEDLAEEATSFWVSLNDDSKKKKDGNGGGNSSKGNGNQGGADMSAMSDSDVMAVYQDAFVEQFDVWRKANPSGAKPFRFQPPSAKRGGRGGAQNNGGGNKKPANGQKGAQSQLSGEEQFRKYPGYDPNKILCHNCWIFGDHFASQCPNQGRHKPQELSNYFPPPRRGAWRGGWRGRGRGGTGMNPIDAQQQGYGYYQSPPPYQQPQYQCQQGTAQPTQMDLLTSNVENLTRTVGVVLNNQAAIQQNQSPQGSDAGSTVYPNVPSPFPSLNY